MSKKVKKTISLWIQFDNDEPIEAVKVSSDKDDDSIEIVLEPGGEIQFESGNGKSFKLYCKK